MAFDTVLDPASQASFEPITDLVATAIAAHPDRVAVDCPQGMLTYAELDARADDVAVALQRCGSGPGSMVPVLAPDRRELVVALLGILRTGGVVVPLDPTASDVLLRHAVSDVSPEQVLLGTDADTDHRLRSVLHGVARDAVQLRVADTVGLSGSVAPTPHRPQPDDPCTVFSTSGSTGVPKGIVGRLGSLDHYIRWEARLLGVEPGWRYSQLTSPAFDAVLREILLPLSTGGTVCVPPAELLHDPAGLNRWLDRTGVAVVHTVPSVFRRLFGEGAVDPADFPRLRCVALSGERLPPADARRFLDVLGDRVRLLNLYGPTETTMTKTFHFVTPGDLARPSIPIGRPMPGVEVLLLDDRGRAAGPGGVGEIHLRTEFRSLGYLARPEATARAFVPDPDGRGPRDVLYRTGDFGRLLPDGVLEYLGRSDHQVKVGGVRVELDGVGAVLREDVAVADAVVVDVAVDGLVQLHGYVEAVPGAAPDPARMRERCAQVLPAAAVPATVTVLAALPRTLSGKIDRRALPSPVREDPPGTPPRTPVEHAVARIWAAVLPSAATDVHRSFFDAGGSSMLTIELLSRLGSELGATVPLGEFLTAPTVAGLSEAVERALLLDDGDQDGDLL